MRNLEKFVIRDQPKSGEFEGLLNSIEFMREELGMPPGDLPETYGEVVRVYEELKAKVPPPTPEQLDKFYSLLVEVGGDFSGELISRAQVELLIKELERAKRKMMRDIGSYSVASPNDDKSFSLAGFLVFMTIGAGFLVSYSFWPEATEGFFYLFIIVLAFVALNLWYFGR